jgi:anti-sigma B factor antagonist
LKPPTPGRRCYAFGLSAHFVKVFTMVGITKYAGLFPDHKRE